ncbi:response regulator [Cellulomonas sp. NPDC057328]|uniref:response regulator n=1 Tax=Cellulomonas sp. NPDC057328 TaxID=3346101 RepID=UPI0036416E3A
MIRVVLVDDQTLVRQGVRGLLGLSDTVDVVAEGADGDEALALVAEHRPDVLLLDLQMPRRDGIATLEALREADDPTPVLVLTTFDDDTLVARALGAGARGYLLKDVTLAQLVDAVRRVAAGERLWQPAVTDRLLRALLERPVVVEGIDRPEPLTARELDVLRLLAAGWSNREIADTLHLAPGTVKNHVSAVLLKLGVRDRTRAVLRALDLGLLGS